MKITWKKFKRTLTPALENLELKPRVQRGLSNKLKKKTFFENSIQKKDFQSPQIKLNILFVV